MRAGTTLVLLGLSTVGSLLVAFATVLPLEFEDRISMWRGSTLTAIGFVFFLSLFEVLNHAGLRTELGSRLRRHYRLTAGEVLDINNKLVSAVQAWLCSAAGAVVCAYSCARDLLHTSHYMSEAYAWFGAAYFFYDIWSMYKVHIYMSAEKGHGARRGPAAGGGAGDAAPPPPPPPALRAAPTTFLSYCKNEPVILMHHLFIGGFGFLVIVYLRGGLGDCVFGTVYLMELSTPLVSARGVLSRMGLKASRLYVINGVSMLLLFFVFRILSLPYVMYMYSRVVDLPYFEAMQSLPTGCKVSIGILMLPQLYWFYLMSAGAAKVLFPRAASAARAAPRAAPSAAPAGRDDGVRARS